MASAPVASKRVPITEIGFGQCRFVVDDRSFPALCCGEPTLGGSWCAQHRALVFVRVAAPSNHRKSAQEPAKAPASAAAAVPVPNGPAKPVDGQLLKRDKDNLPFAAKQRSKPEHVAPSDQRGGTPAKNAKQRDNVTARKDSAGADLRGAPDRKEGATSKGEGKQGAGTAKPGDRSARKPEPSRKSAAAKPPSPAKKAAPSRKGGAAKEQVSAKKAAARKGSAAKRAAPTKKAAASRKNSAAKRSPPAKKTAATGKGSAAKRAAPVKKTTAGRKRKSR